MRHGDLDGKCLANLASKPPEVQILVMETLADRNLHGIRNMAGQNGRLSACASCLGRAELWQIIINAQVHALFAPSHFFFRCFVWKQRMRAFSSRGTDPLHSQPHPSFPAAFFTSHQTQVERDLRDGRLQLPRRGGPPPRGYDRSPPRRYDDRPSYAPPHHDGGYGPPPSRAPPSHYQPQPGQYGAPPPAAAGPPPQYAPQYAPPVAQAPIPAAAPVAPVPVAPVAAAPPPGIKHYALEQVQWGVRVDEFQSLNPLAKYVHPAAALRLQQLWDVEQNKLVSVLNEASWEALAGLDAQNSVAVVNEVAEAMRGSPDDLATINAIFLTRVAKYPRRPDAPTRAMVAPMPTPITAMTPAVAPAPAAAPAYGAAPPAAVVAPAAPAPYGQAPPGQPYPPALAPAPQYQAPAYQPPPAYGGPPSSSGYGPPQSQGPPIQLPGPCGTLPPSVQALLDGIIMRSRGLLKLEHFDGKVTELLHEIGEADSLQILEDFGRNDPAHMRNPTAYLIGCIRKHEGSGGSGGGGGGRGEPSERGGGGGRRGRGGRGGGRGRGVRYQPYGQ